MRICAIVVNYRTAKKTIESLGALLHDLAELNGKVIVVDNASADGSAAAIELAIERNNWQQLVHFIQAPSNGGFGAGNNLGIMTALQQRIPPDYFLLINPDAYPEPGSCMALVHFMDSHPLAGILGTAIRGIDGAPRRSAFRFPSVASEFESTVRWRAVTNILGQYAVAPPVPETSSITDWVSGSCMMIRRQVFESAGMFDEAFFLYFEEIDLCRRAWAAGWQIIWVKDACIVHDAGYSTGIDDNTRPRPTYWFKSRRRYYIKNFGRAYLWGTNFAWLAGCIGAKIRALLKRQPSGHPPRLLRDFVRSSF